MTKEEIREYVKKCPYADKSIDTMHTCKLEFHYRKICPSLECICAEKFGYLPDTNIGNMSENPTSSKPEISSYYGLKSYVRERSEE